MAGDKKTYSEKLKDPRWQKKRLEILERDNFTCTECGDKESPLHVHHKIYIFGNEPWDYKDENFITLCELCHDQEEIDKRNFKGITEYYLLKGHTYGSLYALIEANIPLLDKIAKERGSYNA